MKFFNLTIKFETTPHQDWYRVIVDADAQRLLEASFSGEKTLSACVYLGKAIGGFLKEFDTAMGSSLAFNKPIERSGEK
jgi:hypothetical protein